VPDRRSIFRLLALAGFLLTVALALWLAELRPLLVIIVMAVALLVAGAVEWLSWRQDVTRLAAEGAELDEEGALVSVPPLVPPAPEPPVEAQPVPGHPPPAPVVEEPVAAVDGPTPALAPPPAEVPVAASVEPEPPLPPAEPEPVSEPEPVPVPAIHAPVREPEPVPAPAAVEPPAPEPVRPAPRPVPSPAPVEPVAPQPVRPAAAAPDVIDLRMRVTAQPRRWNLWDLERRARDEAQHDPRRYEEWSYLFVHLRQFATPDGSLPTEFDGLVRESFGELLEHAGG
jgi:hypothetical protein